LKRFEAEGDGFVEELLLEMKPGSNITSRKPRKRARNGTIPPHQNRKNSAHNLLRERLCWLSFWNERGVILEHYMPRGNTVTSATYADLKNHLHPAIKSKWCGLLSTGVLLQHDSAWPHTACSTVATIQDLSFKCLRHPPYSPDLAPSDFHIFGPLKEAMGGMSFRSDEEVQQVVHEWLHSQAKDFFLKVSMHFRSAGTLVWNAMETT